MARELKISKEFITLRGLLVITVNPDQQWNWSGTLNRKGVEEEVSDLLRPHYPDIEIVRISNLPVQFHCWNPETQSYMNGIGEEWTN